MINKAFLDEILSQIEGHFSNKENEYNEIKSLCNKESVEEILVRRVLKTTIQILFHKWLFDNYDNSDEVSKEFLFVERHRHGLNERNDVIQ